MQKTFPFEKPLQNVVGTDLAVLRDVAEGWLVEYKREFIEAPKLAKVLSSFANTNGGILFIGVEESAGINRAERFPGIESREVNNVLQFITQAIQQGVSHAFYFSTHVIEGPCESIALPAGRSIVLVHVPEGPEPPYIHNDGRIYRRVGDSSGPIPEKDRFVLDSLWRKRDRLHGRLSEFLNDPRIDSSAPPNCCIYFIQDPAFGSLDVGLTLEQFRSAIRKDDEVYISLYLQNSFPTQNGYMAQDSWRGTKLANSPSLRWWTNGNARICFPIERASLDLELKNSSVMMAETILDIQDLCGKSKADLIDLGLMGVRLYAALHTFIKLRRTAKVEGPCRVKAVFRNVFGKTPFICLQSFLDSISSNGLPVIPDDEVRVPFGLGDQDFIHLQDEVAKPLQLMLMMHSVQVLLPALRSLGGTVRNLDGNPDADKETLSELFSVLDKKLKQVKKSNSR